MENTTNFSVRTKSSILKDFDTIIGKQRLSRSGVIEKMMIEYINRHSEGTIPVLELDSPVAKHRGIVSSANLDTIQDDPRLKHLLKK